MKGILIASTLGVTVNELDEQSTGIDRSDLSLLASEEIAVEDKETKTDDVESEVDTNVDSDVDSKHSNDVVSDSESDKGTDVSNDDGVVNESKGSRRANSNTNSNSVGSDSSRSINVEATAYIAMCASGCTGITATGYDVRNTIYSPSGNRVIATDPNVIPTGSTVRITLGNGEVIVAEAMDTGGAIKGNRLDLLMSSESEALAFGRQPVEVTIIN